MLYTIEGKLIDYIPHNSNYVRWRSRLTDPQYIEIMTALENIINSKDIFNSSYLPGKEWSYPFLYIYEACDENQDNAALFYGLLCWEAVKNSNIRWCFKPKDEDDLPKGTLYFRRNEDRLS